MRMCKPITILLLALWLLPGMCGAQAFTLKKEHDSLYWLNDWRLPYPVYQFQTGDVDGDGREDAMVGVIKATRFYPEKARLESTADSLYVVSDYRWAGFGMTFDHHITEPTNKETAIKYFSQ